MVLASMTAANDSSGVRVRYFERVFGFDLRSTEDFAAISYVIPGPYRGCDPICWEHPRHYPAVTDGRPLRNRFLFYTIEDALSEASKLSQASTLLVAVTMVEGLPNFDEISGTVVCFYPDVVNPKTLDDSWQRLGYDVADQYLSSALCSNGGVPSILGEIEINGVGLINDVDSAWIAALVANEDSPTHAPFYIFGIYVWQATL